MSSLPPERVNIKRKRGTEPVDILLLRDEQRPDGKRQRFLFQKVSDAVPQFVKTPQTGSATNGSSTHPEDDVRERQVPHPRNVLKPVSREFRLNRPQSSGLSKPGSASSKLATFQEIRAAKQELTESKPSTVPDRPAPAVDTISNIQKLLGTIPDPQKLSTPRQNRIKPRQSAADLAWRASSRAEASSRSSSLAPSRATAGETDADLALAESLSAFAIETTNPTRIKKSPLKFQPKPAPTRGRQAQTSEGTHADPMDLDGDHLSESESDYEYDTYVRVAIDSDSTDLDWSTHPGMTHGFLVIADEDEDLWATYAMDDEQDQDFNTDEDDEDAEDYYKNDYPDEEVASEDEYDRSAYGFRQGGSDDEHYGSGDDEEAAAWSDGEGRPKAPGHWVQEFMSPVQHRGLDPY